MTQERVPTVRNDYIYASEKALLSLIPLNYEIKNGHIFGEAEKLLREGHSIAATPDHKSFGDSVNGVVLLFREGRVFLVRRSVFVVTQKYLDKEPSAFLLKGFPVIPVISPSMGNDPRKAEINEQALRAAWRLKGRLLILTPEAERVDGGQMGRGFGEVASFWHSKNVSHVLPIAIEGTEEQWQRGVKGTVKYLTGGFRKPMTVILGELRETEEIREQARFLCGNDRSAVKQMEVDLVMLDVARLHRDFGNPSYMGEFYQGLDLKAVKAFGK